jgi:hypothetical protein
MDANREYCANQRSRRVRRRRRPLRSGSMKRVGAASGEGASVIASVHKAIATLA